MDKGVEVTDSVGYKTDDTLFTLPEMADYLFMYSSYEGIRTILFYLKNYRENFLITYLNLGYISWSEENGSWFIQSLCEVLNEKSKEWDLLQMLTYVCKRVAINYESRSRQVSTNKTKSIPQIVSTLTKFFKFNQKCEINKEIKPEKIAVINKENSPVVSYRIYILLFHKFLFHYLYMKYSN